MDMLLLCTYMTIDLELEYETVETGKKGTHCIRVRYVHTYSNAYPVLYCGILFWQV